jgi:nitrogen-specific signal transduction histidine kinase
MNERIRSLIERAEYQAQKQSGSDWQVHVEPSREQIFEKFAELIVQEVIAIVKDQKNYNRTIYTTHDRDRTAGVIEDLVKSIVQQLG